jgi:2,3-bisphosphoglycerate-dependent phosphoglycerate mutase
MQVYLIRHAQSHNNAVMDNQAERVADPPLTEVGLQQAERVAQYLRDSVSLEEIVRHPVHNRDNTVPHTITHLFCSPMYRTLQTAFPIARELDLTPVVWPDLHEQGGVFLEEDGIPNGKPGMTRSEILAQFPNYVLPESITEQGWYDVKKGMEHFSETMARAIRVVSELRRRAQMEEFRDAKVALVGHGAAIDAIIKALIHNLPTDRYFYWHYNTAISFLEILDDGVVMIRYLNRVTHLPPELIT